MEKPSNFGFSKIGAKTNIGQIALLRNLDHTENLVIQMLEVRAY